MKLFCQEFLWQEIFRMEGKLSQGRKTLLPFSLLYISRGHSQSLRFNAKWKGGFGCIGCLVGSWKLPYHSKKKDKSVEKLKVDK